MPSGGELQNHCAFHYGLLKSANIFASISDVGPKYRHLKIRCRLFACSVVKKCLKRFETLGVVEEYPQLVVTMVQKGF